jgi:predicted component of type VI protein secretion system
LKANKDAIARQADHNTELIEAMKQMAANAALLEQQKASSKEIQKILSSQIESQASMSENQLEHDGATSTVLGISAYHCWW